jgi:purine-nucleoside phosphorylase
MEAVHLVTDKDNIAEIVLLPGDPLRAKYIAENYIFCSKRISWK